MLPTSLYERLKLSELTTVDNLTRIFDESRVKFQKIKQSDRQGTSSVFTSGSPDGASLYDSTDFDLNLPGAPSAAPPRLDAFETFFLAELEREQAINAWQASQLAQGRICFHLGDYRIVDFLGRGGFGNVFLGRRRSNVLNRNRTGPRFPGDAALKVLALQSTSQNAQVRFLREIDVAQHLKHPNIVQLLNASKDAAVHYAVYEYVDGGDARQLLARLERLPFRVAAYIASETAKALDYLHSLGVVHRDVKPANILLMQTGEVKLADFGFISPTIPFSPTARLSPLGAILKGWDEKISASLGEVAPSSGSKPAKRKIQGTPEYLAPDQIRTPEEPSPLWDVYSLGCALYFMLTGLVPFPANDSINKLQAHLRGAMPPEPATFDPQIPLELSRLTMRMLEREPERRVSTAREVVDALRRWAPSHAELSQVSQSDLVAAIVNRADASNFWSEKNLQSAFSRSLSSASTVARSSRAVSFQGASSNASAAAPQSRFSLLGKSKKSTQSPNLPDAYPAQTSSALQPKSETEASNARVTFEDFEKMAAASAANFEEAFDECVAQAFDASAAPADSQAPTPPVAPKTTTDPTPPVAPTATNNPTPPVAPKTTNNPTPPVAPKTTNNPTPPVAPKTTNNPTPPATEASRRLDAQTQRLERLNATLTRRVLIPLLIATIIALIALLVDALF